MTERYFIDIIDDDFEPERYLVPLSRVGDWEDFRRDGYYQDDPIPSYVERIEGDIARLTFERPFSRIEFRR